TTLLRFDLDRAVYLKVDILDELGRTVVGDESGRSYNPGRHELPLDLSGQASGAYYLRISLGDGEVRTLKLIKKE
ncbi:MAG: T9SS type A sorting domain-containing protein, partial [Candidatus Kapaibacterium sp.]